MTKGSIALRGLRLSPWVSFLVGASFLGCATQEPSSPPQPALPPQPQAPAAGDNWPPPQASTGDLRSLTDLEGERYATEAGRVLAKGVTAQGGWEAWLALPRLEYQRTRTSLAATSSSAVAATSSTSGAAGGEEPAREVEKNRFHFEASELEAAATGAEAQGSGGGEEDVSAPVHSSLTAGARLESASELKLVALPYLLAAMPSRQGYLGAEIDVKSGVSFEKVRLTPLDSGGEEWLVAYFDLESGLLCRTLERRRDGSFRETRFSTWQQIAGVKFATRREVFLLAKSGSRHPDPRKPDRVDLLEDLKAD